MSKLKALNDLNPQTWVMLFGVGVGCFVVYKLVKAVEDFKIPTLQDAKDALNDAYNAVPDPIKPKTTKDLLSSDSPMEFLENLSNMNPVTKGGQDAAAWFKSLFSSYTGGGSGGGSGGSGGASGSW